MQLNSKVLSGLVGACVGDALGVPVEFTSRAATERSPVTGMTGYGTYNQPPGTWSDDSSLMFCLAESMCAGFSLEAIARSFCRWYGENYWTPHGYVFDIGNATREAILKLERGVPPLQAGGRSESSNGNGSLMRILPIAYYHQTLDFPELIERTHQVSCLTHAHLRSQMTCGIYISIAVNLLQGKSPISAYTQGIKNIAKIYSHPDYLPELSHFETVLNSKLYTLEVDEIESSGYVIHTLEASLWCFLNASSYADAVLKAVNLGEDTDTTAAVTGGLAGIYWGFESIPREWIDPIARLDDIIDLAARLEAAIFKNS